MGDGLPPRRTLRRAAAASAVVAVLAAIVVLAVGSAASARSTAQNGRLAFASLGTDSIWSMNADGSARKVLTPHYAYAVVARKDSEPDWSPDGRTIAFTRSRQTTGVHGAPFPVSEIDVMNANGSNVTRLTRQPLNDHSPAWSPDGRKLVFVRERILSKTPDHPFPYGELWVMNANGSGQKQLTQVHVDVCNKNTLSGEGHNLDAHEPAWSPDGTKIAYTGVKPDYPCNYAIYVINADGSGERMLTSTNGPNDAPGAYNPVWSPDGTKIAYQSAPPNTYDRYDTEVYVMSADGSGQRAITRNDGFCPYKCPNHEDHIQPSWSPDGTKIAYTRHIPSKTIDQHELYDVFVANANGSGEKLIRRNIVSHVDWGPAPTGRPNPLPRPPLRPLGHPHLTLSCLRGDLYALVAPPKGIDFVQFFLNGIALQGTPHFFNSPPFSTSYPASRLHTSAWKMKAIVSMETEGSTMKMVLKKTHAPHC